MTKPRVIIADDHAVFAEGIRGLLANDFDVVGIVSDGEALISACRELHPVMVITDVSMPKISGIEAAHRLLAEFPALKVLVLSMHDDLEHVLAALDEGVSGYVLKTAPVEEVLAAAKAAMAGHVFFSPAISAQVLRARRSSSHQAQPPRGLSDKQREVLRLLAGGASAKEAASVLRLSVKTVEYHKYRAMKQLQISTSAGLVRYAIQKGIAAG